MLKKVDFSDSHRLIPFKSIGVVLLALLVLPELSYAQRSRKKKGPTIFASSMVNYFPMRESFQFSRAFNSTDRSLVHTYLTADSGTFVVEREMALFIEVVKNLRIPVPSLGYGASLQIVKESRAFHELSVTRLSYIKSEDHSDITLTNGLDEPDITFSDGYRQKSFAAAFRYELGRYFGRGHGDVSFGLAGAIEPSYYSFRKEPYGGREYPVYARVFNINVGLVPSIAVKLSDKLSMDFKAFPSVLLVDSYEIVEENPTLLSRDQQGTRIGDVPNFDLGMGLVLRYKIKEPKRRRS